MNIMNKKQLLTLFLVAGLLISSSIALAESQLTKLNVNPLTDGKFELKFEFNEELSNYADKLHYRPNQLVVDIEDASSVLKLNPIKIEKSGVNNVEAKRTIDGLRLIIALDTLMPYRIVQEGKVLFVRFGNNVATTKPASDSEIALAAAIAQDSGSQTAITSMGNAIPEKKTKLDSAKETPKGYVNSIKSIDFKRGSEGQGKLLVYLDNSSVAVDIRRRDQQLIAEFQSTHIANEFLYIMDVVDFSTSVDKIETFKEDGKTRFVFDIKDEYNYRYDQLDTLFMIEVSKKLENQKESIYQGKAISLNFQDIPVRTVLQLIADFNGFNLVITDSVSGNITLRLDDVPWEQALDIILKVKGLGKRMDGNVLMIAPAVELAAKKREQLETEKEVEDLAPLYSEFIQINYAKVADIATMLSNGNASLLSSRGAVSTDMRTNTLLLKDTASVIDAVKEMITVLDIPVRQVVIEARMVTVSDSVGEELGIKWGITATGGDSATSGSLEGAESANGGSGGSIDDRLNVNLPVAGAAGTIAFQVAKLADGQILDLELSALEKENKAEIIASPRITTANQQTAYIEQGTEIPYVESASSGATSVSFKKAVLSLEVTPQITPDNKVILDLVITQDSIGEVVPTGIGTAVAIDTQEIGTQVLVENGETLVLGGIYQQRITTAVQKVPLLGDIPYLGYLFRSTVDQNTKAELLIFVTPRIVMQTKY
jgi:type IV pilus assembly protein PilQ